MPLYAQPHCCALPLTTFFYVSLLRLDDVLHACLSVRSRSLGSVTRWHQPGGVRGFKELVRNGMSAADALAESQAALDFADEPTARVSGNRAAFNLISLSRYCGRGGGVAYSFFACLT